MNIHPAIVHFPIALLACYAILEVLSIVPRFKRHPWVEPIKTFLVAGGTLLALLALSTGETAQHVLGRGPDVPRALIRTHSSVATLSTDIFSVIAAIYIVRLAKQQPWYQRVPAFLRAVLDFCMKLLDRQWLLALGALVGLAAITITGALGGAIVYGPNTDPIVRFIYGLFF